MPTPIRYFTKVAKKYGNIDADTPQEVENWYVNELPKLPKKDLNKILDELLQYNNEESIKTDKIAYPKDVSYPLMKNTEPITSYTWANYYTQIMKYIRKLIKSKNIKKY